MILNPQEEKKITGKDNYVNFKRIICFIQNNTVGFYPGLEKVSFHSNPKGNAKECSKWKWSRSIVSGSSIPSCWPFPSPENIPNPGMEPWSPALQADVLSSEPPNYRTIALISHASKAMLKILQDRLQQYVSHELPDVQAGFRKGYFTDVCRVLLFILILQHQDVCEPCAVSPSHFFQQGHLPHTGLPSPTEQRA